MVVAEEGNIGRAATRLFITQPALSRQLQHLEEELGVALLVRVPRGVELTDAGRELLDKARAALDAAEQALTIGRHVEPAGRLAVGVAIAGHRDHWFELGEAFTARYPRVEVEIHAALSELLQRQVVAGELDIAIVLEPNRLPGLSYQQVRAESLLVWMHASHPLADRAELTLADLDGVAVTVMGGSAGRASGFNARIRQLFADADVTPVYVEASNLVPLNAMRAPERADRLDRRRLPGRGRPRSARPDGIDALRRRAPHRCRHGGGTGVRGVRGAPCSECITLLESALDAHRRRAYGWPP